MTHLPQHGLQPGDSAAATRDAVAVLLSNARTRLVVSGRIDRDMDSELAVAVQECVAAGAPVDVDARTVRLMDSAGVVRLRRLAGVLPTRVIQPPDTMRFVLSVTGLDHQLEILDQCPPFPE
ncbi:STAS domain-containing protein [Georgenia deserti]|uniref:STAS domain-containing protein n=1 Tax=Georgenia deserti TaxID=2093781 RepID=A0ABW4L5T4_9MICO